MEARIFQAGGRKGPWPRRLKTFRGRIYPGGRLAPYLPRAGEGSRPGRPSPGSPLSPPLPRGPLCSKCGRSGSLSGGRRGGGRPRPPRAHERPRRPASRHPPPRVHPESRAQPEGEGSGWAPSLPPGRPWAARRRGSRGREGDRAESPERRSEGAAPRRGRRRGRRAGRRLPPPPRRPPPPRPPLAAAASAGPRSRESAALARGCGMGT